MITLVTDLLDSQVKFNINNGRPVKGQKPKEPNASENLVYNSGNTATQCN